MQGSLATDLERSVQNIGTKHLLTLQEGVSGTQHLEMKNAGVRLVVPASVHRSYGEEFREEILSLQDFIEEVGRLNAHAQ